MGQQDGSLRAAGREARNNRLLAFAERAAWACGIVCLLAWGALHVARVSSARDALERFAVLRAQGPVRAGKPDLSLWSALRIKAWRKALAEPGPAPLAVLRIPRIRLEAPVLEGTADETLDRGVGHVEGTAAPGTDGNSGIAGHRDGFFRGLKDLARGDAIEIETMRGKEVYRVERTWIVEPEEVSVLDPTPVRSVTLVTCYPFYFIGSAPQRYIVRAVLSSQGASRDARSR